jgi:hypothetical protein
MRAPTITLKKSPGRGSNRTGAKQSIANVLFSKFVDSPQAQ